MKRNWPVIILAVILLAVLSYRGIVRINDHIAGSMEQMLLDHPLPPDTELVDSLSVAGRMEGNGNGMQYFGAILVKTELSEEALIDYYMSTLLTEEELYIERQTSQMIDGWNMDYWFDDWEGGDCYRVTLARYSAVGLEDSLWEAILNSDLRGH